MHLESREDFVLQPQEGTMPRTVRTLCVSISTTSLLPRFNIELTSKDNGLTVERIFFSLFYNPWKMFLASNIHIQGTNTDLSFMSRRSKKSKPISHPLVRYAPRTENNKDLNRIEETL